MARYTSLIAAAADPQAAARAVLDALRADGWRPPPDAASGPRYLSPRQAAELIRPAGRQGVSMTTVRGYFDDGLLRGHTTPAGYRMIERASIADLNAVLQLPTDSPEERAHYYAALARLRQRNAK